MNQFNAMKSMLTINKNKGFTLIETLVAITILMISIVGPLTIASKGLIAAVGSRDQVIASYLAQDLMEYIKNTRDSVVLADPNNDWSTFISEYSGCNTSNPCDLETAPSLSQGPTPISCGTATYSTYCRLYIDSTNGYYTQTVGSNTPTQFYRSFTITPEQIDSNPHNAALLTVTVAWKNGNIADQVVLQSIIFNTLR